MSEREEEKNTVKTVSENGPGQDAAKEYGRKVSESKVETFHIIMPGDLNDSGRLFGGVLMAWIDEVAGLVGRRHAQMIVINGKVTHVGNKSMEVKVDTSVEHIGGKRELINRAFLTLVGIDENDKPTRLPRLILETEEDRKEWERAERRRQIRLHEKETGFHFYGDEG